MEICNETDLTQAEYYMNECFELAGKGLGRTSPNPIVGTIVLDKNGIPVGKGYHKKAGSEHAEVLAINEAGEKARGGTLIVNLEPCVHHGKTPPCVDLIIKSQIYEVIFSNYDSNPLVFEKGEKELKKNNINVVSRVLESEGYELNKFFFKWIKTKLPWITLKQAQTIDGKVGLKNTSRKMISGKEVKNKVHNLRNIYDAILVGANTVLTDNPELTVREINDKRDNKNPIRIILDPGLISDPKSNVYKNDAPIFLVTTRGHSKDKLSKYSQGNENINILNFAEEKPGKINLYELFKELGKKEILSVLVEAGPNLAGELISNNLVDEYILFICPEIFTGTSYAQAIPSLNIKSFNKNETSKFRIFDYKLIGNDLMVIFRTLL